MLALVDWGDKIYLDGTNTKQSPYACVSQRTRLNVSLSLIGQNGPAYLFCPSGIFFIGRSVEVNFFGLIFYSTPLSFYYCSATIQKSVFANVSEPNIENPSSQSTDGTLKFHSMEKLTIINSNFQGNGKIWVNGGRLVSLYDSRFYKTAGMATTIIPSPQGTVIVDNCAFNGNRGGLKIAQIKNATLYLTNTLFSRNIDTCSLILEFDSSSVAFIQNITVERSVITDENSRKTATVYIALSKEGNNSLKINDSTFRDNTHTSGGVGAIIIDNAPDLMTSKGCKDLFNGSIDAYSIFSYTNRIVFRNSLFEHNIGKYSGAVLIFNGLTLFTNCTFVDNFAEFQAGHLSIGGGTGGAEVYNCTFRQDKGTSLLSSARKSQSFLYSGTPGSLVIKDTVMDFTVALSEAYLVEIVNGGHVVIDNSSSIMCPVGSRLYVDNYSHGIVTTSPQSTSNCALDVKMYSIYCEKCPYGFYSLQRGLTNGTHVQKGFKCLSCPFGADCSDNIVNRPHFWGSLVKQDPPTLQFYVCPLDYCDTPEDPEPSVYNGCHGHRSGVLCGACAEGYSETLFSTACRLNEDCNDTWFWPAAILYTLLVAIFFVTKPPIVPFLVSHIFWFKKTKGEENMNEKRSEDMQRKNSDQKSADEGYLKVIFYFYQVANLLFTSTTGQTIQGHFLVPFMAIFNFQVRTSSSGLGCPFPGLTIITKELFSISSVLVVVLCVFVFYGARQLWAGLRQSRHPSLAPHLSAATEVVLLGYASLATSALKLLTMQRVGPGNELRLFFDGNIVFLMWWQCILLAFVIVYVIPFVGLLFWGTSWLNEKCITAREFLIASVVPLPFLLYWAIWRRKRECSSHDHERAQQVEERVAVMKVLYGPFRPRSAEQRGTLYWESILIGRRLILIFLFAFITNASLRLLLSTMVCVFIAVHHILCNPYKDNTANKLETASLVTLVIFGLFNTVHATFITSGARFWGPIKTYLVTLGWIQACLLLVLPLVLAIAVIFAVLS